MKQRFSLKTALGVAVTAAACTIAGQSIAANASATGETVTVWSVDKSGSPPFKRTRIEVPVADVAVAEIMGTDQEMIEVRQVTMRGKPPYKRRIVAVPVVDAASMELAEEPEKVRFRGRPPFKRN